MVSAGLTQAALIVDPQGDRLRALRRERDRLVAQITRRKKTLDEAVASLRNTVNETFSTIAPIIEKHATLCREIAALFEQILANERLSARARKDVGKVRRSLVEQGVLDPEGAASDDDLGDRFDEKENGAPPREVSGASSPGQERGADSLRGLFRRLALALHPDRTQNEHEREHRTNLMKQVTRAYEEGDLARLVDLEKQWSSRESSTSDDIEAHCRDVERMNQELRAQLKSLDRELREVRRSSPAKVFPVPLDFMITGAKAEIEDLERIRDFVMAFRDGKISLREFKEGPLLFHDDVMNLDDELEAFASMLHNRVNRQPSHSKASGKRRSR